MPSALAMPLRQGVDTDWCKKAALSRTSKSRVATSSAPFCQAVRLGEELTSPSLCGGLPLASAEGGDSALMRRIETQNFRLSTIYK
jgi:hypothetical protein